MGRLAALCILCAMPGAWAHHAAVGFDTKQRYIFKGEVRKFAWVNPHAFLYVDVQKADGTKELWGFETGGPSYLNREGWKITDFPAGAQVTVYAYGARRKDQRNALMSKVVLADGREFKNFDIGSLSPPNAGAPAPGQSATAAPPAVKKQPEYVEYK
jgi:hypothetical protein